MFPVAGHIFVKEWLARGKAGDDEIRVPGSSIGERDDRLVVLDEEIEQLALQERVKIEAPEGSVVAWVLDDRAGIADDRSVQSEQGGDRAGPAIAASGAEDGANAGPGRASDGFRGARSQSSAWVEQRAIDVERENTVLPACHDPLSALRTNVRQDRLGAGRAIRTNRRVLPPRRVLMLRQVPHDLQHQRRRSRWHGSVLAGCKTGRVLSERDGNARKTQAEYRRHRAW